MIRYTNYGQKTEENYILEEEKKLEKQFEKKNFHFLKQNLKSKNAPQF